MEKVLVTSLLILLGTGIGWVACLITYRQVKEVREFDDAIMDSARNMVIQVERQSISGLAKLQTAVSAVNECHPTAAVHEIYRRVIAAVTELKK